MSKTLYLECNAGISGDMTVAMLLDLGADEEKLKNVLNSLPVSGYTLSIGRVQKAGISACDFSVILDKEHENHDSDMEYLHGHEAHHHEHGETHAHEHHHEHRGLPEIKEIICAGKMSERAKATALSIFQILAEAEAKAHNKPIDEVHFHEVGAVDSIVDIVAAAVCLDDLDIGQVIVPRLCEGTGTVRCQHGILPIPVPATANIMSAHHLPVSIMEVNGEFVTPTGAAIVAAVMTSDTLPERFTIEHIGIGAGKRTYELPSLLRGMLITVEDSADVIYKLETNIDDCTGENLGYVMELLYEAGARDVHYMPVFMKKNRPAYQLNIICDCDSVDKMESIVFRETTTIGIRKMKLERSVLARSIEQVHTEYGDFAVKICRHGDMVKYYPEYEDVARLARREQIPFREAYRRIEEAAKK